MIEGERILGSTPMVSQDTPQPFFQTVDFSGRPTLAKAVPLAKEVLRIIGEEKTTPGAVLAAHMKTVYGEDALDFVDKIRKNLAEPIQRNKRKASEELRLALDALIVARGRLASPAPTERPEGWQYVGSSVANSFGMTHGTRKEPDRYSSGSRDVHDQ